MLTEALNSAQPATSESSRTVLENLGYGGSVTLLGLAVVFFALVMLIIIIILYPKIFNFLMEKYTPFKERKAAKKALKTKQKAEKKADVKDNKVKTVIENKINDTAIKPSQVNDSKELIAVITAAITAAMGVPSDGIVIKRLRRTGSSLTAWGKDSKNEQVYNRF